ncbi:MAG TPA: terminase family protein [Acidimicrobiales bacterium]|nr:terminase family protein [Acidimicrobiales bacterium]
MSKLTAWLAGAADPVRLAKQLKFSPDPWQARVLRSTAPRMHLNCSRQVGKSTVTSIAALHAALFKPNATVLIVSPSERQSNELFLKITAFYRLLGKPVDALQENVHMLRLENGSRVISLPASEGGIRGYTVDLLLVDEAAYVPDALYQSVSPMLAVSGGRLVAMSTPAGRRGWWYEATLSDRWEHVTIPATECPRIAPEFLDEERERLGEAAFSAEYMCSFIDSAGAAFRDADVAALFAARAHPAAPAAPRPAQPVDPGMRAFRRHVRSLQAAQGRGERMREREQKLCQHRWRPEPPHFCAFGCGATRP